MHVLRADPEHVGIVAAEVDREGPVEAVPQRLGADAPAEELGPDGVLPVLLGPAVVKVHDVVGVAPPDGARGHDVVGIVGLDGDVAALASPGLDPVALGDRADGRPAGDADRGVVLLRGVDAVGEPVAQLFPASVDRYTPSPCDTSLRMQASPVPA
jgi:hypothetical protein